MIDDAAEAVQFIKRLIGAWDCCGTCAGGVLAAHNARVRKDERDRIARERAATGDTRDPNCDQCAHAPGEHFAREDQS